MQNLWGKTGSKDDWIRMEDGQKVNLYVFVRAVDAEEEQMNIRQCFVENIGHTALKDAEYEFQFYDKLFPEINGKRKFFKSELCK